MSSDKFQTAIPQIRIKSPMEMLKERLCYQEARDLQLLWPGLEALDGRQRQAVIMYSLQSIVERYTGYLEDYAEACMRYAEEQNITGMACQVIRRVADNQNKEKTK